jgi:glycosyltransferase involved in cell wall biosynthesis
MKPLRVVAVLTHPTQYFSPWFRRIEAEHLEIDFTAVYATTPSADRQGAGFGNAFEWDVPLLAGYSSIVLRPSKSSDDVRCSRFFGVDAPILPTLKRLKPDAVLVCGWHSIFQVRTLLACRRLGIPTIYRGDTTLLHELAGLKGSLWRLKTKSLLKLFSAFLSVGARSRDYLLKMGAPRDRIFASPHCVDNDYFAEHAEAAKQLKPLPKEHYGLAGRFVALFAGKLESIKRPADLLAAITKLGGDWAALFVGSGPQETELKREAERLGVHAVFAGFHNQSQMGRAYAAADVFVLPSWTETWGLAVNEALACGVPCVVSDGVGCAPDLIEPGRTGEVFPRGDVAGLAEALQSLRRRLDRDGSVQGDCRAKAATHSFQAASRGLVEAASALAKKKPEPKGGVICIGATMSFVGGLERQTFQVLAVVSRSGRPVHVIGNDWANWLTPTEPHPIKELADRIGATWRVGSYFHSFAAARRPIGAIKLLAEFLRVGRELVSAVQETGARTIFFPDYGTVVRNIFALPWLRWKGVRTVLRIGNAPERTPWHEWMWCRLLPPFVDLFVANSDFGARRLRECGVPDRKIRCVKNAVVIRSGIGQAEIAAAEVVGRQRTILCVGQITPFKGPHLLLDAAAQLLAKGRDFHIAFLGRQPDWPEEYIKYYADLEERSKRGVLAGRVHFLGEVANVQHVMRSAFLLAAPIIQEETFGNVVLEAQMVGLPAVVTLRGGLVELVEDRRTGYIADGVDANSLAEAIDWFLANEGRRNAASKECLAAAKRKDWPYARERYEQNWLDVFAELDGESVDRCDEDKTGGSQLRIVG